MTDETNPDTSTEVTVLQSQLPAAPRATFSLAPQTYDQALQFAHMLADSEMVPKNYRGKPFDCLIAMQWGSEVGLKPLQAPATIAVINGRASMWGDGIVALVRASGLMEFMHETTDANGTAICQVKRRGEPEEVRTFSDADAKLANLTTKDGPWKTNPGRMKQMRARAFALRDVFSDVLRGISVAEESQDLPPMSGAQPSQIAGPASTKAPLEPAVLEAARAAANLGRASFAEFYKGIAPAVRESLFPEMPDLQSRVEAREKRPVAAAVADADGVISDPKENLSDASKAFVAEMDGVEGEPKP